MENNAYIKLQLNKPYKYIYFQVVAVQVLL